MRDAHFYSRILFRRLNRFVDVIRVPSSVWTQLQSDHDARNNHRLLLAAIGSFR
jgi:hypothetical protein